MEYRIEPITRSQLEAEGKRLISSYDMARIVKLWWQDAARSRALFAAHPYLDGPLYVATNKAYFPKSFFATAGAKDSITPQQFYDARCLVVPSVGMFSCGRNNKSLVNLQTVLMQDIKWPACTCDGKRCRCRTLRPVSERGRRWQRREAIGPDNYTTLCKFMKIEYKNGDIKSYLQGGKSVIQTQMLAPRVRGLRAQILCDFKVAADTIVVPETFARDFGLTAGEYVTIDPTRIDADRLPAECVYPVDERLGVIVKRDPCIHPASVSTVSRVAVTERDNFYVSPLTMGHKNADVDGDVYGVYIVESRAAADEIRCALHPRNSMILKTGVTTRLSFSQVHVFYMQGRLHLLSPRFARYAEVARAEYPVAEAVVEEFRRRYMSEARVEWFEPTRRILNATALLVATHLGSDAAYELFDEINVLVTRVSRTTWSTLGDSLACELLCRIAASGAKSSLTGYTSLMDKLHSVDNTLMLTPWRTTSTTTPPPPTMAGSGMARRDFANITGVIRDMAVSAMLVPRLGYGWFKTYSAWSGLQLQSGGRLSYNGRQVGALDAFRPTGLIFSAKDVERLINGHLPKRSEAQTNKQLFRRVESRLYRKKKLILLRLCKKMEWVETFLHRNSSIPVDKLLQILSEYRSLLADSR